RHADRRLGARGFASVAEGKAPMTTAPGLRYEPGVISFHPFASAHFILDQSVLTVTLGCGEKRRATTTWAVVKPPEGAVVIDTGIHPGAIDDADAAWGTGEER